MLYKGKEISQEEFDKLVTTIEANEKLVNGYKDKVSGLEEKAKAADRLEALQKDLDAKNNEIFKIKLDNRLKVIDKYLEKKGSDEKLIQKIGDMSDEDFSLFSEGKTNDDYLSREDIDSAKKEIETKKTEFEQEKDKAVKEALKALNKEKKVGEELVPNSEVNNDDEGQDQELNEFLPLEDLKKLYNLDDSRYDKTPAMEKKALSYLGKYAEKMAM